MPQSPASLLAARLACQVEASRGLIAQAASCRNVQMQRYRKVCSAISIMNILRAEMQCNQLKGFCLPCVAKSWVREGRNGDIPWKSVFRAPPFDHLQHHQLLNIHVRFFSLLPHAPPLAQTPPPPPVFQTTSYSSSAQDVVARILHHQGPGCPRVNDRGHV